jgi:hypothetical protein
MDVVGFLGIALYLFVVAVGALLLWWLIRTSVRRALRDHQLWLESRPSGAIESPGDK